MGEPMTPERLAEIRAWLDGCDRGEAEEVARELLAGAEGLRAELAACRRRCEGLCERVACQSDQLSRNAERAAPR